MLSKISFAAALIAAQTYAIGVEAEAMMYRARPRFRRGSVDEYVDTEAEAGDEEKENFEAGGDLELSGSSSRGSGSRRRGPRGPSRRRGRTYGQPAAPVEEVVAVEGEAVEGEEGEVAEDAEPEVPDEKAGWFNEFQRYSNPHITYQPAPLTSAQYGMCTFTSTGETAGMVRLVQFPGKAIIASTELEGVNVDEQYEMKIRQFGFLGAGESFCMASGPEFNPLKEVSRRGELNPFQDPTRGRFLIMQADAEGKISNTQDKLL